MNDDLLVNSGDKDLKMCTSCRCMKLRYVDFYTHGHKVRSECKKCVIQRNIASSKKRKTIKKPVDAKAKKAYMLEYYSRNREKFAEYRKTFREKHPGYYKKYFRKKQDEALKSENPGDEPGAFYTQEG